MSITGKSEGWLQYEREVEAIRESVKRGEITSTLEIEKLITEALIKAGPQMSAEEQILIRDRSLAMHGALANHLAEQGHPVPGNDPNNPN